MENKQEKSQEDMVKEAVEEAKKSAAETESEEAEAEETEETSEEAGSGDAKEDAEKKTGKKLFGKKKDKKDEKIEELTDKLTRQMAEFDNFRKRTEKEKSQMYEVGAKDIIEKILPVVDNFERGLDAVKEEEKEDPFVRGMEKNCLSAVNVHSDNTGFVNNTILRIVNGADFHADCDQVIVVDNIVTLCQDILSHDFSPPVKAHRACCDIPPEARQKKKTRCQAFFCLSCHRAYP